MKKTCFVITQDIIDKKKKRRKEKRERERDRIIKKGGWKN